MIGGKDGALLPEERTLVRWARRVSRDPSATTEEEVDSLRALGYDDRQIFAITLFVVLRLAFSTVTMRSAPPRMPNWPSGCLPPCAQP